MGKQGYIYAADLNTNLLETLISFQEQILQDNRSLHLKVERLEALLCSALSITPPTERVFTSKEVCEKLHISRNTLLAYKKSGKIKCSNEGGKVLFTETQVNNCLRTQHPGI